MQRDVYIESSPAALPLYLKLGCEEVGRVEYPEEEVVKAGGYVHVCLIWRCKKGEGMGDV